MKPKLLLRIAAVIMLLHAFGHTVGIYTWKDDTGPIPQDLIKQMIEQKFVFMGATGSMGAYYEGLGYASTIAMLMVVFILWIIGGNAEAAASLSAKILLPVSLFLLLLGVIELIYFFPFAAMFSLVSALLSFYSLFKLSKMS